MQGVIKQTDRKGRNILELPVCNLLHSFKLDSEYNHLFIYYWATGNKNMCRANPVQNMFDLITKVRGEDERLKKLGGDGGPGWEVPHEKPCFLSALSPL